MNHLNHTSNKNPTDPALLRPSAGSLPPGPQTFTTGRRGRTSRTNSTINTNNYQHTTPSLKLIQWNIKGYLNNYNELTILIKTSSPKIIALQETHLISTQTVPIPINYQLISHNPYGGIAFLIHKSIEYKPITLNNDLEALGISIVSKFNFSVINVYIPPSHNLTPSHLEHVLPPRHQPSLILGDFNGWDPSWGSPKSNHRGRIISNFINKSDYQLLNDGSPTHFSTHSTFTHIDLSFCSPNLTPHTQWEISDDLCGSDHFPITIRMFPSSPLPDKRRPKFKTDLANWNLYQYLLNKHNTKYPISDNPNKEAAHIHKIILESANQSIPQTHPSPGQHKVPWWNKELAQLKEVKNRMWRSLKHNISPTNLINYKRANAQYKRKIKISKSESIHKLTSEINPNTPTTKIWSSIKKFCGTTPLTPIHTITPQTNKTTTSQARPTFQSISPPSGPRNPTILISLRTSANSKTQPPLRFPTPHQTMLKQ